MSAVRVQRHIRSSACDDYLLALHIATRWGFRSQAHFTRAFHARYGITPAELRRTSRDPRYRSP
jgi:AraC-like DNA-binding protein